MSNTYGTIITTKGAAIIADCIVNGGQLVISEAAAGDGNGAYYQPTVNQEHLVHECWRGEIAAAELNRSQHRCPKRRARSQKGFDIRFADRPERRRA